MLTDLIIRNFKSFEDVSIDLGNPVVFVGPNNSGKTSALQALALWHVGLRKWLDRRKPGETAPEKRPGVTINRRDVLAVPVPETNQLWRDLHVRRSGEHPNVRIEVVIRGAGSAQWECGLEFDYANRESLYCRPLRTHRQDERIPVPAAASEVSVAYLPPMSGLSEIEFLKQRGEIDVLIGQGRTAEVLRNLFYLITTSPASASFWEQIHEEIGLLFGVDLQKPEYNPERGEITMSYKDARKTLLDLSCAGRGLHQTLLLLAYIGANPGAVLLLDEPDAHLEILRQRQTYDMLARIARERRNQIIIASHSEVILNEAADRDVVIAFLGKPRRIDDRGAQLAKSLKSMGYEHYLKAEIKGWVLYLEGATDYAILRAFAERLGHRAAVVFSQSPYTDYVQNQPRAAQERFRVLRQCRPDLRGLAVFDRLEKSLPDDPELRMYQWQRNEIENYLCQPETLLAYANAAPWIEETGSLFAVQDPNPSEVMQNCLEERLGRAMLTDPDDPYWIREKASGSFLNPLFDLFFKRLNLPNLMSKTDYHRLVPYVPAEKISEEVIRVLDLLVETAGLPEEPDSHR